LIEGFERGAKRSIGSREVSAVATQVAIFRSYRLYLPPRGSGGGDSGGDYVETHEYSYAPIESRLTVDDDSILDFWHGSGATPYLIAELPEGYTWSGALGDVRHKGTGEALPADQLAVLAGADGGVRKGAVRGRPRRGAWL
jgi:hypothetical protein